MLRNGQKGRKHRAPPHSICSPHPESRLTPPPASGEAAENDHAHVQPLLDPDLAHDANHLQGEHVLAKVVPTLDGGRRE